jgi:hypothetical protein
MKENLFSELIGRIRNNQQPRCAPPSIKAQQPLPKQEHM